MPTPRYIETVFESLEIAVEFGVIEKWSIAGTDFIIQQADEQTTVPSIEAADYLIDLFQQWDQVTEEAVEPEPAEKIPSRTKPVQSVPIERELARIELPKNSIHLVA